MTLPDTITFHGGSATVAEARDFDLFGFKLDRVVCFEHKEVEAGGLVVNVVGQPDASFMSGWVLLLG